MTEQELKILIDKKIKHYLSLVIVYYIVFGEAQCKVIMGKTKLLVYI